MGSQCIRILLVSPEDDAFAGLESGLKRYDEAKLYHAATSSCAFGTISREKVDLVVTDARIADMTGVEFARKLVSVSPMVNCAVVSSLCPERFHEESEGLGILMQIPVHAGEEQAAILLDRLSRVLGRTQEPK